MKIGFDNSKYIKIQSKKILEKISKFEDKLYLEFGGKLYNDFHAARILPGFNPNSKMQMLSQLKDKAEIVIVINANDIYKNKIYNDLNIPYYEYVIYLAKYFKSNDLIVNNIVITHYFKNFLIDSYKNRLTKLGYKVYLHYKIDDYPNNINNILSKNGYGKNEYIKTEKPLVIITAPGPGSGKMATCLSQIYNDSIRNIRSKYAKFETFPIWDLPLLHPLNLAYEAATANLNDINMIDPYHLEYYKKVCVNYNRDIEIFPVLKLIFERIYGESPYKSPTDMGVNTIRKCIIDNEICEKAAIQEIIRRYYTAIQKSSTGFSTEKEIEKIKLIMNKAKISLDDRQIIKKANNYSIKINNPACAIMLNDNKIILGKEGNLLNSTSATILNSLKYLANIDKKLDLINKEAILPIQKLKTNYMNKKTKLLNLNETLICLSISSISNKYSKKAFDYIHLLKGCEIHSSTQLSVVDIKTLKDIGINITMEPTKNIL